MTTGVFDRVYGCIIGGAIGDALGAPVQGWSYEEIREKYGRVDEFSWYDTTISEGRPGSVTGDTVLRHYLCLAIVENGGRITPDELADIWDEYMDLDRVWVHDEIIYLKLQMGMNPWETGRETLETANAVMGITPVGVINAGDPRQAYQDAFNIASLNQDSVGRDTAAVTAAGVATAIQPDATVDDVVHEMADRASGPVFRAIDLTMAKADESNSIEEFVDSFYDDMLNWRSVIEWDRNEYLKGRNHSFSPLEIVPVVMALVYLTGGDPDRAVVEGASFGRQSDTIASLIGGITGAMHGASALRDDWIEQCEAANRELLSEIEGGETTFEETARRLVDALERERDKTAERAAQLERLLDE
jgi:ADP-ribosylglycohydrolase